jgi:glycosyltransferase involved in cell wall biosynthesis
MLALCNLVRRRDVDIVHGYEWTTALEAYWGPRALLGVPATATVMSMAVAPFLPRDMPLVVGTEQIAAHERQLGRTAVDVIEPPVDVRHNSAGAVETEPFRSRYDLDPSTLTVVCVSRLSAELKLEGLLAAIDAVADVAATVPVQLVIVGDGPSRPDVAAHAEQANLRAGRQVAILTGELRDPRPAYAAADVCLAMGGSALRSMAFGRPGIVQGEQGFWELLTPETEGRFLWTGWYGVGDGAEHGRSRLGELLREVLASPVLRAELGRHGRGLVESRFALEIAGARQLELYRQATSAPVRRRESISLGVASASGLLAYTVRRRTERVLGRARLDDFNSKPVAALPGR